MDSLPLTAELLPELAEAVDPGTTPLWTALRRVRMPLWCTLEGDLSSPNGTSDLAYVPALPLSELGDPAFRSDHGLDYACVAGAMANGIASVDLVEAMGRAGMVGFFGAAGLDLASVGRAVRELKSRLGERAFGMNLIHSPSEPNLEAAVADLYLREHVTLVEASAFLDLTLPLVRYRLAGIRELPDGTIATPHRVVAKVSRVEVAAKFMAPAPAGLVQELVRRGDLTPAQARLAERVPVAQDLTAEADSAGHTDNRPALTLLPTMLALRDRMQARFDYAQPLRVGAAGGIATPAASAAALAMGAAYIVTGSVNQACRESGTSDAVRQMLAQAEQADTMMAPAADMFEMGVKVQVLKRGTMFPMRAAKLYELYRAYPSLEALPASEREHLEKSIFRTSFAEVWEQCQAYFSQRDAEQLELAARDPKHRMALVFRWYLGQSSRWANQGVADRRLDYQVWCGPAMGAFNEWTRDTFLAEPAERKVAVVAMNLLFGAALSQRLHWLRSQRVRLPHEPRWNAPLPLAVLREWAAL